MNSTNWQKTELAALLQQLDALEETLELDIGFHDYLSKSQLPLERREHRSQGCLEHKKTDLSTCIQHCGAGGTIDTELTQKPQGCIQNCPFGRQQIAVPVFENDELSGYLFALPKGKQTRSQHWLDLRQQALLVLRTHLGQIVDHRVSREIHPREKQVTDFLCTNLENPITLEDLSHQLGLSPSHTSRWVSQHFNKTFLQLLLQLRLRQAALWLSRTELSVTKISFKLQFCDQAHFSKMFKREFKCSPLKHRQQQKELGDGALS